MEIENLKDFIKYIKMRLGEPIIRVELTDEQIHSVIDDIMSHDDKCNYNIKKYIKTYHSTDINRCIKIKDECVKRCYKIWMNILNKYPNIRNSFGKLNFNRKYVCSVDIETIYGLMDCDEISKDSLILESLTVAKKEIRVIVNKLLSEKGK